MWRTVRLSDLCKDYKKDIVDGPFGSNLKSEHFLNEGIPVLKIQNIKEYKINDKKIDYVSEEKFIELRRHSFKNGDLVMTKLGSPLGVTAFVENIDEGLIVADLVRIRSNNQLVNVKFLQYQLNSPLIRKQINSAAKGATRQRINIGVIRNLLLLLPPLAEQQRIVAKLDAAFAEIDRAVALTEDREVELVKLENSLLCSTLTTEIWKAVMLGSVCELTYGKALPANNRLEKSEFPAYGANGVKTYATSPLYSKPSIVIGRKGSAGEITKVSVPFWALDVTYYVQVSEDKVDLDYLFYVLINLRLPRLARGVKPGINRNDVYKQIIPLPTLAEQKALVIKLDSAFKKIAATKLLLADSKEKFRQLKSTILTQALQPPKQ